MKPGKGTTDQPVHANGTVADAIAAVLKREGVEHRVRLSAQPGARSRRADRHPHGHRPPERTGLHMADAVSRMTKGEDMGVFVMQQGPGAENAFGGVAQAFADCVPVLVMPQGYALSARPTCRTISTRCARWRPSPSIAEPLTSPGDVAPVLRRAFAMLRNGRPQPVVIELPYDVLDKPSRARLDYVPGKVAPEQPAQADIEAAADALVAADEPGDLCRAGRPLVRSLRRIARTRRAPRDPGDDQPAGQERLRRDPPARARLGRQRDQRLRAQVARRMRPAVRRSAAASPRPRSASRSRRASG